MRIQASDVDCPVYFVKSPVSLVGLLSLLVEVVFVFPHHNDLKETYCVLDQEEFEPSSWQDNLPWSRK